MRWLSRGKGFAKRPSAKEKSLDATMDSSREESNAALTIARDNARERGEAKQIEQRILLAEMASRLRIALFAEVGSPKLARGRSLRIGSGAPESPQFSSPLLRRLSS